MPPKNSRSGENPCIMGEAARIKLSRTFLVVIQATKL